MVIVYCTKPTTEPLAAACGFEQEIQGVFFIVCLNRFKWFCKGTMPLPLCVDESQVERAEITCPRAFPGY